MDNLTAVKVFVEKGELLGALYDADAITMQGVAIINQFPAADVAPVVRCRECNMWVKGDKFYDLLPCMRFNSFTHPNDFCSFGERKEGAE